MTQSGAFCSPRREASLITLAALRAHRRRLRACLPGVGGSAALAELPPPPTPRGRCLPPTPLRSCLSSRRPQPCAWTPPSPERRACRQPLPSFVLLNRPAQHGALLLGTGRRGACTQLSEPRTQGGGWEAREPASSRPRKGKTRRMSHGSNAAPAACWSRPLRQAAKDREGGPWEPTR